MRSSSLSNRQRNSNDSSVRSHKLRYYCHNDQDLHNLRKYTDFYDHNEDEEFYIIGDRVLVDNRHLASVAFFGETDFPGQKRTGGDWVGVVLDEPLGTHDGKYHGREYFQCSPNHGLFVRPHRVTRLQVTTTNEDDSAFGSSSASSSSRLATPLPTFSSLTTIANNNRLRESSRRTNESPAGRVSSADSPAYFYDDDYRQQPGFGTLERKLKSGKMQTPRHGILKQPSSNDHHSSNIGSKVDELARRLQDCRTPGLYSGRARSQESVFNFRPRREQMSNKFDKLYDELALRGQLSSASNRRSISLSASREPPRLGERVRVRLNNAGETQLRGVLRFMGQTQFATGEWAGVELEEPVGKNDGSVLGQRYFDCPKNFGIFVPATRVKKLTDVDDDDDHLANQTFADDTRSQLENFGTMRSTIKSPPPLKVTTSLRDGGLRYGSTTPSYEISSSTTSSPYLSPVPRSGYTRPPSSVSSLSASFSRAETPMSGSSSGFNREYSCDGRQEHDALTSDLFGKTTDANHHRSKFDERDIELELRKSLRKPLNARLTTDTQSVRATNVQHVQYARPKAVTYTFTSSKYDGNPIARRTLIYE